MDRIFHARIAVGQYLSLALITCLAVQFLWLKQSLLALLFLLWLIVLIERLIHTTYMLTADGRLLLYYGRFSRRRETRLEDIVSVERASSMQVCGRALVRYVLVRYKNGRYSVLLPMKEEEFLRVLSDRMRQASAR